MQIILVFSLVIILVAASRGNIENSPSVWNASKNYEYDQSLECCTGVHSPDGELAVRLVPF